MTERTLNTGYAFITLAVIVGVIGLFGWVLRPIWPALLLSCLLYLLLQKPADRLAAYGLSYPLAITLILIPPFLFLILLGAELFRSAQQYLPSLAEQITVIEQGIALALSSFEDWVKTQSGLELALSAQEGGINLKRMIKPDSLLASSTALFGIITNVLLFPLFTWFMLRDFRRFRDRALSWLPNRFIELGWLLYFRLALRIQHYIGSLFVQMAILAIITSSGFYLAGFPSPVLLGVLTGVAGLVPFFGPFLALIAPVVVMLSAGGFDPQMLLMACLVIGAGFTFDNLVVIPFLIAGAVNVHPMVALAGVLVAGHLGGIAAMIVVIPLLGMAKIIMNTLTDGLAPSRSQRH